MASSSSSSSRKRKADYNDEFSCSICKKPFDNGEHQAKYLPCFHSFCKSCLKSRVEARVFCSTFNCPDCNFKYSLPGKTVDSLPNNFLLKSLKEHLAYKNAAVSCGNCEKGHSAVSFCDDCGCFQCQNCTDSHQMIILKHHRLSTMKELREKNRKYSTQRYCKTHPFQKLNLYCKERSCRIPVCATCNYVNHRRHNIVDATVAANEVVSDMEELIERVKSKKRRLVIKWQDLEDPDHSKALHFLEESYRLHRDKMIQERSTIQSLLQGSLNSARNRLDRLHGSEKGKPSSQKSNLKFLISQMSSAYNFATTLCDAGDPIQLLTSEQEIMNRLEQLDDTEIPKRVVIKTELAFTKEHNTAMEQILECLKTLTNNPWVEYASE